MTKIKILDTPQAYKDIVEFNKENGWILEISEMDMIGKEFTDFYEPLKIHDEYKKDTYIVEDYYFPKSACEIIEEPNYLEQARESRRSLEGKVIMNDDYFDLLNSILKTQDLILKHLESKEVQHERD